MDVVFAFNASYWDHFAAAVRSVRCFSSDVAITAYTTDVPEHCRDFLARNEIRHVCVSLSELESASAHWSSGDSAVLTSRFLKITAIATHTAGDFVYLDADTLVNANIEAIPHDLDPGSVWMYRHDERLTIPRIESLYLRRADTSYLTRVLRANASDTLDWWNSGVLYGCASLLNALGRARRGHLLAMMLSEEAARLVRPSDQLPLWAALRDTQLTISAMPSRWNRIPIDPSDIARQLALAPCILHLERHKNSSEAIVARQSITVTTTGAVRLTAPMSAERRHVAAACRR